MKWDEESANELIKRLEKEGNFISAPPTWGGDPRHLVEIATDQIIAVIDKDGENPLLTDAWYYLQRAKSKMTDYFVSTEREALNQVDAGAGKLPADLRTKTLANQEQILQTSESYGASEEEVKAFNATLPQFHNNPENELQNANPL